MVTRKSHSSNDGETRNFSDVTTDTIIHRTCSPSTSSSNDGETRNFSDVTTNTITHRTRSPSTNSSDGYTHRTVQNANIGDGDPTDPPSDERNLTTHPTQSPATHNAPVVAAVLVPNPPSVPSPVADPPPNFDTNHFELISKSALSRLRNEAKLGKKICQKMQGKKYVGSPLGDRLIGIAIKLSLDCAERLIPLFLGAFLCDCGFEETEMKNLGSVTPSANKIKAIMIEETVDTILTKKKEMRIVKKTGRIESKMKQVKDGEDIITLKW